MLAAGGLQLDLETRQAQNERGEIVSLTPKEAWLLAVFMQHAGLILSRRFLMRRVWETDYVGDTRTVEVHVCWLRRKLGSAYIKTIRGRGYQFVVDASAEGGLLPQCLRGKETL